MTGTDTDDGPWRVPAQAAMVRELRNHARAFAAGRGADPETAGIVAIAVSEAATNAVMHAFVGREPGTITLTCEAGPGEVRVQVTDDGRGMQPRTDSSGVGMGLTMLGRLVTRMSVRPGASGTGTTVSLVFRAPGVRGNGSVAAEDVETGLLLAASELARSAAWPQEGIERLCRLVLPAFADAACVDVVEHGTLRRLAAAVHEDPGLSARLSDQSPPLKPGTATWSALHGGGPRLVVHDPTVPRSPVGPGAMLGLGWWLSLPLADTDGVVLGLWGMGGRGARPVPGEATIELLAEAAARAAGGLANARLMDAAQGTRRRLEAVLSALGEAVTVTGPDGHFAYANDAAARLLGAAGADELLRAPADAWLARFRVTDEHGAPLPAAPAAATPANPGPRARPDAGVPVRTRRVDRQTGRTQWLSTRTQGLPDAAGPLVVEIAQDITEVVRGEHRARVMLAAGAALDTDEGLTAALPPITAAVAPVLADSCAIDLLTAGGELERVGLWHPDALQRDRLQQLRERWPGSALPPAAAVLESARPCLVDDVTDALLQVRVRDENQLALLRAIAFRSVVVAPLRAAGRTVGLLTLAHDERSGRRFDAGDVACIADLGRRIGAAVASLGSP